jgi:methionyl-tRNA formyltransferase
MTVPVPDHPRRLVYLGTPEMAVPPLRALHAAGWDIALVVSRADAKRGRGGEHTPSPVKAAALELGLPVTDEIDDLLGLGLDPAADLGVVVAYGRIIRPHVLDALPMVNIHFSLLPRWRGAAPVERAILAGDTRTGVCLMAVEEGLDPGGIYARAEVAIGADETAAELRAELVSRGTELLVTALGDGLAAAEPQVGDPIYAEKVRPEELALDWDRSAEVLHRVVRVGGAWTTFRGRRLKVWRSTPIPDPSDAVDSVSLLPGQISGTRVRTGEGQLELIEVQPEGKGRQPADAWRNGARPSADERLGS